jgi:hypothetical protein
MKRVFKAVAAFMAMIPYAAPAFAVCAGNQIELLSCSFGSKQVELCMTTDAQSVTYRFGPQGAPELELTRGFDEITMQPWNGIGRTIWDSVTLHNGQFSYALYAAYDKIDRTESSGLEVLRGEQGLASLDCIGDPFFDLDTLRLTMEQAGYCRKDTADALSTEACE